MHIRLGLSCAIAAMSLAGCSSLGISNRSLEYKTVPDVAALSYPSNLTPRAPSAMYPAPNIDALALQNAPLYANKRGDRFALPRPDAMAQTSNSSDTDNSNEHVSRPFLMSNNDDFPLLRIEGPSSAIWQYTLATLSVLNYQVQSKPQDGYESTITVGEQSYLLKLNFFAGRAYDLQLFQLDNQPADADKAKDILTQIYQNWPTK